MSQTAIQSSTKTARPGRIIGLLLVLVGALTAVAGIATYFGVGAQLNAEHISITGSSDFLGGAYNTADGAEPKRVNDPLSAFAQAEVIKRDLETMPGQLGFPELDGKTPAEVAGYRQSGEVAEAKSEQLDQLWTLMNTATFLRSSLMLAALSFGVALLVVGVGVVSLLAGIGLLRLSKTGPTQTDQAEEKPAINAVPVTV